MGTPGGGWIATRDFWKKVQLYQHCVVGGADSVMAKVFLEFAHAEPRIWTWKYEGDVMRRMNIAMRMHIIEWARRVWGKWRIGFVRGQSAYLLSHGNLRHRKYADRHQLLNDHAPALDVRVGASGAWEWNSSKPSLHRAVASYFANRNEDD